MTYLEGTHEFYTREYRHWCPRSEAYTGGDSLLSALRSGWELIGRVYRDSVLMSGSRFTAVYYFELRNGSRVVTMPIVGNPWVVRFVAEQKLAIVNQPNEQRELINLAPHEEEQNQRLA